MRSKHFSTSKEAERQKKEKNVFDGKKTQSVNIKMIQFKLMFRCFNFHFNLFMFCNLNYQSLASIASLCERRACV